jgi:hypothetical protein
MEGPGTRDAPRGLASPLLELPVEKEVRGSRVPGQALCDSPRPTVVFTRSAPLRLSAWRPGRSGPVPATRGGRLQIRQSATADACVLSHPSAGLAYSCACVVRTGSSRLPASAPRRLNSDQLPSMRDGWLHDTSGFPVRDAGVQNRPIQSLEVIEIVRFTQKKVRPESAGFAGLGVPLRLPPPAMRAISPVNGGGRSRGCSGGRHDGVIGGRMTVAE